MGKSNDQKRGKKFKPFPKLDYSRIPKDIEEAINKQPYKIDKDVKLTWDGRQFLVRVPKEIADELQLTEEWRVNFVYEKPLPDAANKIPRIEIRFKRKGE